MIRFIVVLIILAAGTGWCINVGKFVKSDFDTPLKAEVIRGIGVFVPPVGAVVGYIPISDVKKIKVEEK
jgi:hypothetical protein